MSFDNSRSRSSSQTRSRSSSLTHSTKVTISCDVESSTQIDTKTIKKGHLGRGYNILDGSICAHVFEDFKAFYFEGLGKIPEKTHVFQNYEEFDKELAQKIGVKYEKGMLSLRQSNNKDFPIQTTIEKVPGYIYLMTESEEILYKLSINTLGTPSPFIKEEEEFILQNPFSKETKYHYYTLFERIGTHYIKSVSLGCKAEMVWSVKLKHELDDPLLRISKTEELKTKMLHSFELWKNNEGELSKEEKKVLPKNCFISRSKTENFSKTHQEKLKNAVTTRFTLESISVLFKNPTVKSQIELAVKVYLEEMKPKTTFTNDKVVGIFCLDNGKWVTVDDHGHMQANSIKLVSTGRFSVKCKGNRIGLRSVKYKSKYISRSMIRPSFHFHRLQLMGPHESFEIAGDYLLSCGNFQHPSFLYLTENDLIHYDGSSKKRNRFVVLDVEVRDSRDEQIEEVEPDYGEEDSLSFELFQTPNRLNRSESIETTPSPEDLGFLKDNRKANSTSSLFIKDTITLPNIDILTRCMAIKLHKLIKTGHGSPEKKFLEVFDETKYPLSDIAISDNIPSAEAIYHFINTIFKVEKLNPEPGIMSIVYVERVLELTGLTLHASNWRRVTLACLILASKVWEDQSVWNVDFLDLFPRVSVRDLNRLEQHLLDILSFKVSVKASEYVKVYFDLKNQAPIDNDREEFKPMDQKSLKQLEVRSASSEEEYARFNLTKSATLSNFDLTKKHGRGVLS